MISATGTVTADGEVDPISRIENAIAAWVVAGSGLAADHVIWASAGGGPGGGGPAPTGLYISLRITGIDAVSDDWRISRRVGAQIVHHVRGTRHPTLELTCSAGSSYGARRAEMVLSRTLAAAALPSVAALLRAGEVGLGSFGRVRVMPGVRSGMLDPKAIVEVPLHIMIDVAEQGGEFRTVGVTTPGPVAQTVTKP